MSVVKDSAARYTTQEVFEHKGRPTYYGHVDRKMADNKKYGNTVIFSVFSVIIVVFSVMFMLAMFQYRAEMDELQKTIYSLKSDILVQMAKDRNDGIQQEANTVHKVHKREADDSIIEQTLDFLERNATSFYEVDRNQIKALQSVAQEILSIKDGLTKMKHNFSKEMSRLEHLSKQIPDCTRSRYASIFGNEIINVVLKLASEISSLKRVVILSSVKSTVARNNVEILRRFECTLKEALGKIENRINNLENMTLNVPDNPMNFEFTVDDIRKDIRQIATEIKSGNKAIMTSVTSRLDVVDGKCSDKELLETVFNNLKSGVTAITNSTSDLNNKLQEISEKSASLKTSLESTNSKLNVLQNSQTNVGETCAANGQQAVAILEKLDLFNETEPELNYTTTEYCARRHGCIKVKEYKKHCYKIYDNLSTTWYGASEACAKEDAYLVEINSDTEYKKLATFITRTRYYWVGGTDINSEGSWYWSNSKERIWLNAWRGSNPSNDGGVEHCMHLYANRISWNDANCLTRQSFICERDYNCVGWD